MSKWRVLTIRMYTNGAQRSASGAVFLDPEWSIPMIQITFPPFRAKFVRLSVNLPLAAERLARHYSSVALGTLAVLAPEYDPVLVRTALHSVMQVRTGGKNGVQNSK